MYIHAAKTFKMRYLLVLILQFHAINSILYNVVPNDNYDPTNSPITTITFQHYLNNTSKYAKPQNELLFMEEHYILYDNWLLQNAINVTINGNNSTFSCSKSSLGIAIIDVINVTIKNFRIKECNNYWNYTINNQNYKKDIPILRKSAIFIYHSADVVFSNTSITINDSNTSGIICINIFTRHISTSSFTNTTVLVLCENSSSSSVSGIMLYYSDDRKKFNTSDAVVTIQQYNYRTCGLCNNSFALRIIVMQKEYDVIIHVNDTNFTSLFHSSALLYYAESCRNANKRSLLNFFNCKMNKNKGNEFISMFIIEIQSHGNIFNVTKSNHFCSKVGSYISFRNCDFLNNTKMNSLIHILLKHNEQLNVLIEVRNSNMCFNNDLQLVNTDSELKLLKALSHTIIMNGTKIQSNSCVTKNRISLIALTSGIIELENSIISDNSNFENIIKLHSSLLQYVGVTIFSGNHARFIIRGTEGTYFVHAEFSTVHIINNFIYSVSSTSISHTENSQRICAHQFITKQNNDLDDKFKNGAKLNFTVELNNTYTASKYEINFLQNESYHDSCVWLANTAFQNSKSTNVFKKVFNIDRKYANKANIGRVPSSVCPCSSTEVYNCSKHEIGAIYSGQKLTIKLIFPVIGSINTKNQYTTMMAKTYNYSKQGCHIVNADEISQTRTAHECKEYNYTIWYDGDSPECELYLGTETVPETFYVNLIPCPAGFSLQKSKRGCYCDQTLNTDLIKITSCNLEDGTVERPANSWISGQVINNSNTYTVCTNCPFDYCLPLSSYINLSNPDSQCQFDRSGLLCGHCPNELSAVFGSSDCMLCSNFTLLVVLPIALGGILLVMMLFILDLTVINGTMNTFIFYFNIVSINISVFISRYNNPFSFITLSLFNLDLGFKTCFYDGMDDYAKTWLQLAFPVYLIVIALSLIMGSRHSRIVQRITARRGLSVLATLFLLSYTKVLLTVCHAIFFYSTVTHLPSEDSTLVWSVDTNIPLFGVKFTILFVTCLIIFLILIPFDILLLFTRSLMRFKFVSTFKPLIDVYFGPYKDRFYYWTGLQLLLRTVFFVLSTFDLDVNLTSSAVLLGILLCFQGVAQPFKSRLKNIHESVLLLNLLALYVTSLYNNVDSTKQLLISWYLVFPVLIYFITFIICHCFTSACGNVMKYKGAYIVLALKNKIATKGSHEPVDMENLNIIPAAECSGQSYEEFQEPLIALSN